MGCEISRTTRDGGLYENQTVKADHFIDRSGVGADSVRSDGAQRRFARRHESIARVAATRSVAEQPRTSRAQTTGLPTPHTGPTGHHARSDSAAGDNCTAAAADDCFAAGD